MHYFVYVFCVKQKVPPAAAAPTVILYITRCTAELAHLYVWLQVHILKHWGVGPVTQNLHVHVDRSTWNFGQLIMLGDDVKYTEIWRFWSKFWRKFWHFLTVIMGLRTVRVLASYSRCWDRDDQLCGRGIARRVGLLEVSRDHNWRIIVTWLIDSKTVH